MPVDGPALVACFTAGSEETPQFSSGSRLGTSKVLVVLGIVAAGAVMALNA